MKILIISANMGSKATNTIAPQSVPFDFIRLDDSNFPVRQNAMHPRLVGKIPKMMAWDLYPGYDVYLWIDAPFSFKKSNSLQWYLDQLGNKEAAFFAHPNRHTIDQELQFMLELMDKGDGYLLQRYEGESMVGQVEGRYLNDKNFVDDKLFACTSFIYTKKLVENKEYNVMKEWFFHNCMWSVQDQLSLPYLLHKFNVNYNTINEDVYKVLQKL